jgi:hypothetical protein
MDNARQWSLPLLRIPITATLRVLLGLFCVEVRPSTWLPTRVPAVATPDFFINERLSRSTIIAEFLNDLMLLPEVFQVIAFYAPDQTVECLIFFSCRILESVIICI